MKSICRTTAISEVATIDLELTNQPYRDSGTSSYIVRNGELIEFKADKLPVSKHVNDHISFTEQKIELEKGDMVYTFTDGFPDQFGGPNGKKFKYKPLKKMLLDIAHLPMDEQKQMLHDTFMNWKGDLEQIDDLCLLGVRI